MKKNRNKWLSLACATFLFSCQKPIVEYKISDKYSGPCIVFIYPSKKYNDESNNILISNGLAKISDSKIDQVFILKSLERNKELKIIDIGKLEKATNDSRYIFQLVSGFSSSKCSTKDLHIISFFVGYKSEYLKWSEQYHDEFEYFDSTGLDWCSYYKSGLGASPSSR